MGRAIADRSFESHLTEYSRVVDGVRDGTAICTSSCDAEFAVIEARNPPARVSDVWGARCNDGGVIVLFRLDTDVPFLHEGYFFKAYGEKSNCSKKSVTPEERWHYVRYIRNIQGQ